MIAFEAGLLGVAEELADPRVLLEQLGGGLVRIQRGAVGVENGFDELFVLVAGKTSTGHDVVERTPGDRNVIRMGTGSLHDISLGDIKLDLANAGQFTGAGGEFAGAVDIAGGIGDFREQ